MQNKEFTAHLYVIAAPSGAGKTSLVKALVDSTNDICVSVSHTTRPKRSGETEGVNYYFVDENKFQSLIASNAFLEYARVFQQHYYGTSYDFVIEKLSQGIDVILEIDWQGATQIKKIFPAAVGIFILPPSQDALIRRLESRGTDDKNTINTRMAEAKNEMSHYHEFDYIIINDQFDEALKDLKAIVRSGQLQRNYQLKKQASLLDQLLR